MKLSQNRFGIIWIALAALIASGSAFGETVVVNFTVSGFDSDAPEDVISGSFQLELNDNTNEVTSISSVSLTINGHAFSVSELGFSEYRNFNILGAQGQGLGSSTGISHGASHDFWILWNKDTSAPREFAYTASVDGIHTTRQFDTFSIEPAS